MRDFAFYSYTIWADYLLILTLSAYKNMLVLYESSCTTVYASMEVKLEFLIWWAQILLITISTDKYLFCLLWSTFN